MQAFTLTLQNAEMFFELCKELKADTEEERVAILQAMAELGKVKTIVDTKMSKEDYIKHLAKHFKVLQVKEK
jgi:translation initiation factor 1 (eIF-1/SUI1)